MSSELDQAPWSGVLEAFRRQDTLGCGALPRDRFVWLFTQLDPGFWCRARVEELLAGAGMARSQEVDYGGFIGWLSRPMPVKLAAEAERERFLVEEWEPFLAELRGLRDGARRRRATGHAHHEVMPSHVELAALASRCLRLTLKWHGRGNVGPLYSTFMEAAELDGHSPYKFQDIPRQHSADGYTRVLDGQVRQRLYANANVGASKGVSAAASASPLVAASQRVGLLAQEAGESPIDNLVLPSIMGRREALLLLGGHRIQQWLLRTLRWKQKRLLASWGLNPRAAVDGEEEQTTAAKARAACAVGQGDGEPSIALRMLAELGYPLESYGQLPPEVRATVAGFLEAELGAPRQLASGVAAPLGEKDCSDEELREFVEHCRRHPGRSYRGSGVQHKLMLFRAMASPALRLLWRSDMEPFTQHKYFTHSWRRTVPLLALGHADTAAEMQEAELVALRPADALECTRFRKNVFPYAESHGLGQSGGGCAELGDWPPGSLMYEFGTMLCADEGAKVPNHWVTDIEKIVRDCLALNAPAMPVDALPGEAPHDVGQNPVFASSIGKTQHTQVMAATAADYPLIAERHLPCWYERLGAWVDLVPVGEQEDAFFLSIRTPTPDSRTILLFLTGLRARMLREFGRTIDFNVSCHPNAEGEFIIVFAPVACIRRIAVPAGEGANGSDFDFENSTTGQRFTQSRVPVTSVDCSHGKGNILAFNEGFRALALEGRPVLARLYDLNRRPGARAMVEAYLRDAPDVQSKM